MGQRMFLEEIGRIDSMTALGNTRAWVLREILDDGLFPPLIYLVESEAGERFLLGRELSGRVKFNLLRYIAKSLVEIFFERLKGKETVQYLLLPDAYPFDLQYAMGVAPPYDRVLLPTLFVQGEKGAGDDLREDMAFLGQEFRRGRTWVLPKPTLSPDDTVVRFLRKAFSFHRPEEIYLFTACGSLKGIGRVYEECRKEGVQLVPVVSQCLFDVSTTDPFCSREGIFPILSPTTIASRKFFQKATERYQGREICAVGDVLKSLNQPVPYSIETLRDMMHVGMDPAQEDWEAWTIDVRSEEVRQKIQEFDPVVFEYFRASWEEALG